MRHRPWAPLFGRIGGSGFFPRNRHPNRFLTNLMAVKRGDSGFGFRVRLHVHKAESARAIVFRIDHHERGDDRADRCKKFTQLIVCEFERKATDK